MYNRYIPERERPQGEQREQTYPRNGEDGLLGVGQRLLRQLGIPLDGESKNAGIAGILKGIGLEDLDSGDILLLLILLLVFLEGDNIELVITLGLMLLLGEEEGQTE